ncbi:MAG: PilZ domain-containing protein [Clostridium sp.]
MENLKLGLNQRVEILWDKNIYVCNVQEDIDGMPVISIPVYNSEYLTLKEGEMVDAVYYNDNYGVFGFVITIQGRRLENNIPCYVVSKPFNIKKIQRRDYVRVTTVDTIKYAVETSEVKDKLFNAILLDLSGGGLRLKMKEKLSTGDSIVCELKSDMDIISVKGRIVRVTENYEKDYTYGVCFEDISENIREKIIRTVFLIMRKQRELS